MRNIYILIIYIFFLNVEASEVFSSYYSRSESSDQRLMKNYRIKLSNSVMDSKIIPNYKIMFEEKKIDDPQAFYKKDKILVQYSRSFVKTNQTEVKINYNQIKMYNTKLINNELNFVEYEFNNYYEFYNLKMIAGLSKKQVINETNYLNCQNCLIQRKKIDFKLNYNFNNYLSLSSGFSYNSFSDSNKLKNISTNFDYFFQRSSYSINFLFGMNALWSNFETLEYDSPMFRQTYFSSVESSFWGYEYLTPTIISSISYFANNEEIIEYELGLFLSFHINKTSTTTVGIYNYTLEDDAKYRSLNFSISYNYKFI